MNPTLLPLLACSLAAAAQAQHIATWFWTVSDTGNGDGLVEPGESAMLTLSVGFDPPQPQEGGGIAGAIYDIRDYAGAGDLVTFRVAPAPGAIPFASVALLVGTARRGRR